MSVPVYVSSRGGGAGVDFATALLEGYASDGGLFVPDALPQLPWRDWRGLGLPDILKRLLPHFLDTEGVPVHEMVDRAYGRFDVAGGVRVEWLRPGAVGVVELFHGPTWAFKDYSLIFLGELLHFYAQQRKERRTILVATSGDTGSSAMEAVAGKDGLRIFVLYPSGRISAVQRHQMVSIAADNVHPIEVDGDSDELDAALLPLYGDASVTHLNLGCINSINWARILVQMAHWFWTYFQLSPDDVSPVKVFVPTGACGNITAGVYAREMGLPVEMVACTGHNDIVHRLVQSGTFRKTTVRPSLATAMDIQVPYNVERILHLLSGQNANLTKKLMADFASNGTVDIPTEIHSKLTKFMSSQSLSDDEILGTMKAVARDDSYFVCPHTATALHGALRSAPALAIATAAPAKFGETLRAADVGWEEPPTLADLRRRPVRPHPFFARSERGQWTAKLKELLLQ